MDENKEDDREPRKSVRQMKIRIRIDKEERKSRAYKMDENKDENREARENNNKFILIWRIKHTSL